MKKEFKSILEIKIALNKAKEKVWEESKSGAKFIPVSLVENVENLEKLLIAEQDKIKMRN